MTQLTGTGVALVTPFDGKGKVDVTGLSNLIEFVIAGGVDYIVALGTTAETAVLTKAEKELVVETVVKVTNGRLPLVLGIGGNNTASVVDELASTNLEDFSAILSVAPYYNRPGQEGIYAHFKAIAEASPIPVIVYNVPARTGCNMTVETTLKLAYDFDNIIGIKEASGDLNQITRILKDKPEDFLVISGDDMLALPICLAGGVGVISVVGQGLPLLFSKMIRLGIQGEAKEAYAILNQLIPAIDLAFEEGNPAGIKAILENLKICKSTVRLPLTGASRTLKRKVATYMNQYAMIAQED
ncbi:4-hydroxy-tetrahydrodipicolinate synthase [Flavobacteriaceae bacterium M23B6Z8]